MPARSNLSRSNGLVTKVNPRVSVITVTFNAEKLLEETIKSVITQDYEDIEYIVVDGASTDGTKGIIERYRQSIHKYLSEPDFGIYDAINKGIKISTGSIIKIQNADDLLLPGAISTAVKELGEYILSEDVLLIGASHVIDQRGNRVGRITKQSRIYGFESFNHPGWFVPAAVYKKHGLYSLDYKIASDYEYYLRFKKAGGNVRWIENELVCYRQDGASAGWTGVLEVASINRIYFGLSRSWMVRIQHQGGKLLRPAWRGFRRLLHEIGVEKMR